MGAAALNAPIFAGAGAAAVGQRSWVTSIWREHLANDHRLDASLSQWVRGPTKAASETKPANFEEALAQRKPEIAATLLEDRSIQLSTPLIRSLSRIPYIEEKTRANLVSGLIAKAPENPKKPDDGNSLVESLLESQIQLGHTAAVKSAIEQALAKPPVSLGKMRSFMLAAARMKDVDLLQKIESKATNKESLWLDTFVRNKDSQAIYSMPQLDRGNTLMHMAITTGDVQLVQHVFEKMSEAYESRKRRIAPGQSVEHRLPIDAKKQKIFTFLVKSEGKGRQQEELDSNPFHIRNSMGKRASEMLTLSLARALDEANGLDSNAPGSCVQAVREKFAFEYALLVTELGLVAPGKLMLNAVATAHIEAAMHAAMIIGGVHAGPVGAVAAAAIVEFFLGTGVLIGGAALGFFAGKGVAHGFRKAEESLRGYGTEITQMKAKISKDAQEGIKKLCFGLGVDDTELENAFNGKIENSSDLAAVLAGLNATHEGFAQAFADKLSRMSLVQSGEITQAFSDALDKAAPEATVVPKELTEFAGKSFGERKQALNALPRSDNFELLKEIDRYLDSGQTLSDQQLKNLNLNLHFKKTLN